MSACSWIGLRQCIVVCRPLAFSNCHELTQAPDLGRDPSEAVVDHTIRELQRLMWAHFRMAALPEDTLASLPCSHITAQLHPARLEDFERTWAYGGVLCQVLRDPPHRVRLRVSLSLHHPLGLHPPAGAAEPGPQQQTVLAAQQQPLARFSQLEQGEGA